jgi:hypothetical protein
MVYAYMSVVFVGIVAFTYADQAGKGERRKYRL